MWTLTRDVAEEFHYWQTHLSFRAAKSPRLVSPQRNTNLYHFLILFLSFANTPIQPQYKHISRMSLLFPLATPTHQHHPTPDILSFPTTNLFLFRECAQNYPITHPIRIRAIQYWRLQYRSLIHTKASHPIFFLSFKLTNWQ